MLNCIKPEDTTRVQDL
jgi:hypothetical protein